MAITSSELELEGLKYCDLPLIDTLPVNAGCIKQSIYTLFSIMKGELLNYSEYGADLKPYLFTSSFANSRVILMEIMAAVKQFEPRVEILSSSDVVATDRGYNISLDLRLTDTYEVINVKEFLTLLEER